MVFVLSIYCWHIACCLLLSNANCCLFINCWWCCPCLCCCSKNGSLLLLFCYCSCRYCWCLFCYIWSFVKRETVSEQVISSSILNVSGSRGYFSDVLTLTDGQTDRQSLLDLDRRWNVKTKRNLPVTGHVDRRVINVRSLHLKRF